MKTLERIIESSKKVIKKVERPFIGALAGLTLLTTVGCKSTLGKKWVHDGDTQVEIIHSPEPEKRFVVKYHLGNENIQKNKLIIPVKEDKHELLYKKIGRKENWIYEEKEIYIDAKEYTEWGAGGGGIGLLAGLLFGLLTYKEKNPDIHWSGAVEQHPPLYYPNLTSGIIIGTTLGTIVGLLSGKAYYQAHPEKCKTKSTGRTRIEDPGDPIEWELGELTKTKELHLNKISTGTSVFIESNDVKFKKDSTNKYAINLKTNNVGNAEVEFAELPYNKAFSIEKLEEKIKSSEIVQDIKDQTRKILLPQILKKLESAAYSAEAQTIMHDTEDTTTVNDKKILTIWTYEIPEEKIYLILEDFINKEINSKIKEARIRLIDESTHTPIQDANLNIETEAPSKTDLAKQYFEDKLLEWGITKIRNYLTGQETIKYDSNGEAVFSVYTPNAYKTESTHKKYAFAKFNFDFSDPKKLKQTIEMSQDPQKIRIVDK